MSSFVDVVQAFLGDPRVKVLIAVLGIVALTMPVIRYVHDRRERRLREREVRALERVARALERRSRR